MPRVRLIRFHREPRLTGPVGASDVMERTKKVGFAMPIMSNRPDLGDNRKVGL
jgi:hypothetical protein